MRFFNLRLLNTWRVNGVLLEDKLDLVGAKSVLAVEADRLVKVVECDIALVTRLYDTHSRAEVFKSVGFLEKGFFHFLLVLVVLGVVDELGFLSLVLVGSSHQARQIRERTADRSSLGRWLGTNLFGGLELFHGHTSCSTVLDSLLLD